MSENNTNSLVSALVFITILTLYALGYISAWWFLIPAIPVLIFLIIGVVTILKFR